jgi:hypothetical protein
MDGSGHSFVPGHWSDSPKKCFFGISLYKEDARSLFNISRWYFGHRYGCIHIVSKVQMYK